MQPSISHDGRYIAFASEASNLVSGPRNTSQNIFRHDRQTNEFRQITFGQTLASRPKLALDGRIVAFDRDIQPGKRQVELYDFKTQATEVVSIPPPGYVEFTQQYRLHGVSEDGSKVLFGANFGETDYASDLFLRDRTTRTTVQIAPDGLGSIFHSPQLAARGRFIFYTSRRFSPTESHGLHSLDLKTGTRRDETPSGPNIDRRFLQFIGVSGDARFVLIQASATRYAILDRTAKTTKLLPDGVDYSTISSAGNFAFGTNTSRLRAYRCDLATNAIVRYGATIQPDEAGIQNIAASDNGEIASFDAMEMDSSDVNFKRDVAVFDGVSQQRLTRADLPGMAFLEASASLSDDLRFAAITTGSPNMGENVFVNRLFSSQGVYLRDRTTGQTNLISVPPAGQRQNYHATGAISGDGNRVIYGEYPDPFGVASGTMIRYDRLTKQRKTLFTFSGFGLIRGISTDGRYLLLVTDQPFAGESDSATRVYRFDTDTLISTNLFPGQPFANSAIQSANLSSNGQFAVIAVRNDSFASDFFRVNISTGGITSPPISGIEGQPAPPIAISASGQFATFQVGDNIYRWDSVANTVQLANQRFGQSIPGSEPAISPDGRRVSFRDQSAVYVYDFTTGGSWGEEIKASEFQAPRFLGNGSLLVNLRHAEMAPTQTYRLILGVPDPAP